MRTIFASMMCLLLVACGESHTGGDVDSGPSDSPDGSQPALDAGPPIDDPTDAGPPVSDAGPIIQDAGPIVFDAGPAPTVDASVPTEPGGIGGACADDADCSAAGGMCLMTIGSGAFAYTFPGGYCTAPCTGGSGSTECGAGAACYSLGTRGYCVKTCASNADCRVADGYMCMSPPFVGGSTMYCLPPIGR
jgi:hypothetical protein